MQAVGELDDDHADIVAHRDQHLADILRLTFLAVGEFDLADFGQTVDEVHDLFAEHSADLFERHFGILYGVVQQRRDDGIRIHPHLGKDTGYRGRMQDERHAGDTALVAVSEVGEFICFFDFSFVVPDVAFIDQRQ